MHEDPEDHPMHTCPKCLKGVTLPGDFTEAQYEQALVDNGFTRSDLLGHVKTSFADGTVGHICEAAAQDMYTTRREVLADLIATRHWENTNG